MKYAHVKDGQVVNLIEWDGESDFEVDGELIEVPDDKMINPGYTYQDGEFIAPQDLLQ